MSVKLCLRGAPKRANRVTARTPSRTPRAGTPRKVLTEKDIQSISIESLSLRHISKRLTAPGGPFSFWRALRSLTDQHCRPL